MSPRLNLPKKFQNFINLLIVGLLMALVLGCFCRSSREITEEKNTKKTETAEATPTPKKKNNEKGKAEKPDEGDFIVEHLAIQETRYSKLDEQIKRKKILENAANELNRALVLPHDIILRTKDCQEVNALYDPNDRSITVCYELMEHFYKLFKSTGISEEEASDQMFDAVRFVFLHELGHALIDAYQLPITGNEEDAADRISSIICLEELGEEGARSTIAAADAFAIESKGNVPQERDFYDEHLLQEQRFYNILCMTYGYNPEKYSEIVTRGHLPKERAVRCENEYQRNSGSWANLLKPYRKR